MTASKDMQLLDRLYVSSVSPDAEEVIREYGLGLEIAQFCTAFNMDEYYADTEPEVKRQMALTDRYVFHAPFNELSPASIDKKVLAVTTERYEQALSLALSFGVKRLVYHSGYVPLIYFKEWFQERSIEYWKNFLSDKPSDITVCLENVMDSEPELLTDIVKAVDDPRFRLCLDIGHANTFVTSVPIERWVEVCAPYIGHLHIHNNEGGYDCHDAVFSGTIPMYETLTTILNTIPRDATVTLETIGSRSSVEWLIENKFLNCGKGS